jgi:hypothetical protein
MLTKAVVMSPASVCMLATVARRSSRHRSIFDQVLTFFPQIKHRIPESHRLSCISLLYELPFPLCTGQ